MSYPRRKNPKTPYLSHWFYALWSIVIQEITFSLNKHTVQSMKFWKQWALNLIESHLTDLRFQGPNFVAGHFNTYWTSPTETKRVRYRLTNCEEIWNFFPIHFSKIHWQKCFSIIKILYKPMNQIYEYF